MKNLLVSLIAVTFIQTILNYPPPQPVQAQIETKPPQVATKPIKKKVVKDATPKKKATTKPVVQPRAVSRSVAKPPTGTCADWIKSAGIVDVISANELIRRESNCNPNAVNPSSGACNVAQELPCGKSGCQLGDGACSVKWMNQYVIARYGSWANAVAFHDRMNWY